MLDSGSPKITKVRDHLQGWQDARCALVFAKRVADQAHQRLAEGLDIRAFFSVTKHRAGSDNCSIVGLNSGTVENEQVGRQGDREVARLGLGIGHGALQWW